MAGQDPRELLRGYENRWRAELDRVSLVAELEFTRQDINTALFCLGLVWKNEHFGDRASARIRTSYPASFVVAVAGSASIRLVGGRVLPEIFEAAGLRDDGSLGNAFGKTFIACLAELGLPTFPELDNEAAYRYVGRMLLHGGVPLDHFDEWLDIAETARGRLGDVSRQVMQAWLVERADEGRLYGGTKTLERFLRYGEEFAADFLDRSLDLLDRVRDGDGLDELNVGLARRYLERSLELREANALPGVGRRQPGSVRAAVRPEVRFDPYVLGVHLVLPSVVDDLGGMTWIVDMEGRIERLSVRASRPGLLTPEVEVPLPSTVAHVDVSRSGEEALSIRVVDLDDPHLVFDGTGRRVERTGRLSRETAWSVHPSGRRLDATSEHTLRVIESHESIPRWPGWAARLLDLRQASQLLLEGGRGYLVSGDESARFVGVDFVGHVRTEGGLDVMSAWPTLRLPGRAAGATWEVSVSLLGSAGTTSQVLSVGSEALDFRLSELVDSSFAWSPVRIRARGPLGRSLRSDVLIAPELDLALMPPLRSIEESGLSPARGELRRGTQTLTTFTLEPSERTKAVTVEGTTLLVDPPAVAIQYVTDSATGWRSRPLSLDADEVAAAAGSLIVRLPGASRASLQVLDAGGVQLQVVSADGHTRADGARRFDLARVTDTLRSHGSLVLVVDSDVWRGRVAVVRPARLAADVDVYPERGIIEFRAIPTENVRAGLYPHFAPTLEPHILEVPRGDHQAEVPEGLLGVGPLRVLLRIDDPWVPVPWPLFPTPGPNVYDIDDLPVDSASLEAAHPFAGYLAGREELDDHAQQRLGDALRVYDLADSLRARRPPSSIRYDLREPLTSSPDATLVAALDAAIDGRDLSRIMVQSGLVSSRVSRSVDLDRVEALWTRWPAAGLIAAGDVAEEATRRFVTSRSGPAATELLEGRGSASLASPRMDEPCVLDFDSTTLSMLRAEAGIAPKYLLDADTRADDGFALVRALQDHESHNLLAPAIREADSLLRYFLAQVLPTVGLDAIQQGIRSRIQGEGWQLLPAASLAAATGARLAPRATGPVRVYTRQVRTTLEALVATVPRLVAADLVMAELAIQGAAG